MSTRRPFAMIRAARTLGSRASIVLALFVPTTIPLHAQDAPSATPELPTISGRVVREFDGAIVVGANVEAHPAFRTRAVTTTDERGEFVRVGRPTFVYTTATNLEPYDRVNYLTISGPGIARTLVDPCADAPWATPIRVRRTATIRGCVENAPNGRVTHVVVIANSKDMSWPPRTGLTNSNPRWLGDLDAEGRFEIRDVPAEVPLDLQWNAGTSGSHGIDLADDVVLAPDEVREWNFRAPDGAVPLRSTGAADAARGPWIPVAAIARDAENRTPALLACELVDGWRFQRHRNGGGRYHVHGWRACNHLEALPGTRTLVAFDASGRIGLERFEVRADAVIEGVSAEIAPGALLRIEFDGPEERARIALSSRDVEFAVRELPRGVVWYELSIAGPVTIGITSAGSQREVRIEPRAGVIERVDV